MLGQYIYNLSPWEAISPERNKPSQERYPCLISL
jgi:hypothetical protein